MKRPAGSSRKRRLPFLLAAGTMLAACGAGSPPPATSVERDSAGIRIVESAARPDGAPTLQVAARPLVQIGVVDGAPEYQLHRVQSVTRLADGTLVVANSGSQELRFYDAAGTHLRTVGGQGSGPGEFRALTHLHRLAGDTLLVFDAVNRRITLLDATGRHVRDWSTADGGRILRVTAALADGTLLVTNSVRQPPGGTMEIARDTVVYEISNGATQLPIPRRYAGSETRIEVQERGGQIFSFSIMTLPFSRTTAATAAGDAFVIGANDTYELHVYDRSAKLRSIVRRLDVTPSPVTPELVQRHVEANLQQRRDRGETVTPEDEATARRQAQSYHRVPSVPAYGPIVGTAEGGLWVRDFIPPGTGESADPWAVYDADGRLTGGIRLPAGFRPLHIEDDVVTGVIQDEFGVEYVRVYRIERAALR